MLYLGEVLEFLLVYFSKLVDLVTLPNGVSFDESGEDREALLNIEGAFVFGKEDANEFYLISRLHCINDIPTDNSLFAPRNSPRRDAWRRLLDSDRLEITVDWFYPIRYKGSLRLARIASVEGRLLVVYQMVGPFSKPALDALVGHFNELIENFTSAGYHPTNYYYKQCTFDQLS